MSNENKTVIRSFRDLQVYQRLYENMVIVMNRVIPTLPKEERYDLSDQLRRACKAAPALIAEGFAKRYQKKNWKKYLIDTTGEYNEMINHLSVCVDVYNKYVDTNLCNDLIESYDIGCRQLTKLSQSWQNYHDND